MKRVAVLLLAGVLAACAAQRGPDGLAAENAALDELLCLLDERLMLAQDVARYKWNKHLPVTDAAREREVLDRTVAVAAAYLAEPELARRFMQAQIDAGKIQQQAYFQRWADSGQAAFAEVPDLNSQTRPRLETLTPRIFAALRTALPGLRREGGAAWLQQRLTPACTTAELTPEASAKAQQPLLELAR